jgi:ABC-type phosphate/phosphonate transport system substrate-binding protein
VPASVRFSGSHLQVMRDLDAGLCDVGAIFSGAYLAADRAGVQVSRLRVLVVTGRSPQDAICSGPAATPDEIARLRAALLSFDPERELGRSRIGDLERVSGFADLGDAEYDGLRRAVASELGAPPR